MFYLSHPWIITNLSSSSLLRRQWLCISPPWVLLSKLRLTLHTPTQPLHGENSKIRQEEMIIGTDWFKKKNKNSGWATSEGHILLSTEVTLVGCFVFLPQEEVYRESLRDVTWPRRASCVETYPTAARLLQEITLSVRMGRIAEDNRHPVPHAADDSWLYTLVPNCDWLQRSQDAHRDWVTTGRRSRSEPEQIGKQIFLLPTTMKCPLFNGMMQKKFLSCLDSDAVLFWLNMTNI